MHLGRVAVALVVNDADEVLMLWRYRSATEQWGMNWSAGWWMVTRMRRPPPGGRQLRGLSGDPSANRSTC